MLIRALVRSMLLMLFAATVAAKGVYQKPDEFINEVFVGAPPAPGVLWLSKKLRGPVEQILGHPLGMLRVRYWGNGQRSAWVLEEVGKEQPITTGIVIRDGTIERIKVLIFRESRGWEVRHDFFTDQFTDAALNDDYQLDREIDGISGATLSVRALTKLARLALFLSEQVTTNVPP